MIKEPVKSFRRYDANIQIWNRTPVGPVWNKYQDMETYKAIRMLMVGVGFSFHQNPRVKKNYRTLAPYNHCGGRGGLGFTSEISGIQTEIRLFESALAENKYGSQYDHDRMKKMSYLGRKRVLLLYSKIGALLLSRGFECTDDPPETDGLDWIRRRRANDFPGRWAETGNREYIGDHYGYQQTDADGRRISEGETRYAYSHHGHLMRGRMFYALNHMWLLVDANGRFLMNHSCGAYFNWRPGLKRREVSAKGPLEKKLADCVKAQNFERAIQVRDVLRRLAA